MGDEPKVPAPVAKISSTALLWGRVLLILAAGVAGLFSRRAGGIQENQIIANALGHFGLPYNFAGMVDIAALTAGAIELTVGSLVFALPYMVSGGDSKMKEGAKWVCQPTGGFLIGRGGELALSSLMVSDNSGMTVGAAIQQQAQRLK